MFFFFLLKNLIKSDPGSVLVYLQNSYAYLCAFKVGTLAILKNSTCVFNCVSDKRFLCKKWRWSQRRGVLLLHAAYSNKHSKFVRLPTCSWPHAFHPSLSKGSHWLSPLTDIHPRLSSICWCHTADVIGCSLLVFTDGRGRTWKYLPLLL